MEIIDISMEIKEDMPVYKDRTENSPVFETVSSHEEGSVHQSRIDMDMHTGTHIDAPLHMLQEGASTEIYDWNKFITSCQVIDLTDIDEKITADDLQEYEIKQDDFLIFKTQNSFRPDFTTNFVYLEKTGAEYLVKKEIKGVGTDALGIERAQPGHETHKLLLDNEIIILEGLRLKEVNSGYYQLILLPLKIRGVEGAPARAVLTTQ